MMVDWYWIVAALAVGAFIGMGIVSCLNGSRCNDCERGPYE